MIIINGKIITMEEDGYADGFVRIAGDKIVEIGSMEQFSKKASVKENKDEIIDVHGAWVMPGLIDAHAHIGITEEKWGAIADDCNEET